MHINHSALAAMSSKISSRSMPKHLNESNRSSSSSRRSSMSPHSFLAHIWFVLLRVHFHTSCGDPCYPCKFLRLSSSTSWLSGDYWYCSTIVFKSWKVASMLRGRRFSVILTNENGGCDNISTFNICSSSLRTAAWASSNCEKEAFTFMFYWESVSPTICCSRDFMVNWINFCFSERLMELKIFLVFELVKKALMREGVWVSNTKLPSSTK